MDDSIEAVKAGRDYFRTLRAMRPGKRMLRVIQVEEASLAAREAALGVESLEAENARLRQENADLAAQIDAGTAHAADLNRVEVIEHGTGRAYSARDLHAVEVDRQDDRRTLKIFVTKDDWTGMFEETPSHCEGCGQKRFP